MYSPFEIEQTNAYYDLLQNNPEGAKQIVGSKMSEEKLGKELRDPVSELRVLCGIFEGYKQSGEPVFIRKAEEYLGVWSENYDPDAEKGVQISLDQRYFSWVFIETEDCWDALTEEGKRSAAKLAQRVLEEEGKFWVTNRNHNNRYSYSILTRMAALGVLDKSGDLNAASEFQQTKEDFFNQVRQNVYEDGSTIDFRTRDSVHYQVFNQIAWETSRVYLQEHSVEIPVDVVNKLDLALDFSMRFITGDEVHNEFINSQHERDKNIQGDKVGKPFDRRSSAATQLLEIVQNK